MEEQTIETPYGEATDGTIYNAGSPEVVRYLKIFPDVSLEAAIGSVISMKQNGTLEMFMDGEPVNGVETDLEELTEEEKQVAIDNAQEYDPSEADMPGSEQPEVAPEGAEAAPQESV